jgi:hypothetical protein
MGVWADRDGRGHLLRLPVPIDVDLLQWAMRLQKQLQLLPLHNATRTGPRSLASQRCGIASRLS